MGRKNSKTEDFDYCYESDTYQTGATQPPKSRSGLIAFLLGLVIFLSGISTALGMMNIRLFQALNNQSGANSVAFSQATAQTVSEENSDYFPLGFRGQAVPAFWNHYDALPKGIYITEVCANAAKQGLRTGDILISIDGNAVADTQALLTLLEDIPSGQRVQADIYREGSHLSCKLTVD